MFLVWLEAAQIRAAALGQTGRRCTLEHEILDAVLLAILALVALVAVLVHGVNVRLQFFYLRVGIQPAVAAGNQRLLYELDRADDVTTFSFRQQWMASALQ